MTQQQIIEAGSLDLNINGFDVCYDYTNARDIDNSGETDSCAVYVADKFDAYSELYFGANCIQKAINFARKYTN